MSRTRKKSTQRSERLKKIGKRLAAYSAAAAATVVAGQDRTANAGHVRHDIPAVTVGTDQSVNFFMNTGATSVTSNVVAGMTTLGRIRMLGNSTAYPGPWVYVPFAGSGFLGTGSYTAIRLGLGDSVKSTNNFVNYALGGNFSASLGSYWAVGDRGFVGIKFDLAGGTHYGWADVTRGTADTATLHAFGYNDEVGEASIVGAPEPSSILLLAAGAAGLAFWRRKKKSGKAA